MRTCFTCKRSLSFDGFHKNRAKKFGIEYKCKECLNAYRTASYKSDPAKRRAENLLYKFGLTVAGYDAMRERQGGVCAICLRPCGSGKRLAVDHDHTTGKIRGLLCLNCNQALGKLDDSLALLDAAAAYLRASRE